MNTSSVSSQDKVQTLFDIMLKTQAELNARLDPNWLDAEHPWHTAIWTECAELVEHLSPAWKWWKKAPIESIDWNQVQMEIVDILHFYLSWELESQEYRTNSYSHLYANMGTLEDTPPFQDLRSLLHHTQSFVYRATIDDYCLEDEKLSFCGMCTSAGLSLDLLYKKYIGKVQLNKLRWANGYGSTYQKIWNGREDNEVLTELLDKFEADENLPANLQAALEEEYKKATLLVPSVVREAI